MTKPDQLIEVLAEAKRLNSGERVSARDPRADSERMLSYARRSCLHHENVEAYLSRIESLVRQFSSAFSVSDAFFVVRAPGRVNLIGEHTDYNGLPVLPVAINRDIILAAAPRNDNKVSISNKDTSFTPRSFEMSACIEPYPAGDWGNYAKSAAQCLQEYLADVPLRGIDAFVDGTIPVACGLASSSALVVAFALAILTASDVNIDRLQLAELLARGEQYVGTRGGGMDQAVCLLAEEGHALNIDFFPLRTNQIPLPLDYRFVVCNSLVVATKASATRFAYNLRSAECRIAAALLGRALADTMGESEVSVQRLGDLFSKEIKLNDAEVDRLIKSILPKDSYSPGEAAKTLRLKSEDFCRTYLSAFEDVKSPSLQALKLRSRASHVISEARRVWRAGLALRELRAEEFGRLMNESHHSCARDYEVSTPELDALVSIAREAGALGARLTGAGFGGCTINLVHERDVDRFVETVEKRYYHDYIRKYRPDLAESLEQPDRIFVCRAVDSACEVSL